MKSVFAIILACSLSFITQAQSARDFITFQGVARRNDGKVAGNQNISLRLGIHPLLNSDVFTEEHKTITNEQGVFTILIGAGTVVWGSYSGIDWKNGDYFLKVEMDIDGGTNYVSLGSTQLASVPYSHHAKQADRWKNNDPVIQTGDANIGASLPTVGEGSRLIWYPRKAAFLAGYNDSNIWRDENIGQGSSAFGFGTIATGQYATAFGFSSTATGSAAISGGQFTEASGSQSFAMGRKSSSKGINSAALGDSAVSLGRASFSFGNKTLSQGDNSLALGAGVVSKAFGSVAIGAFNNVQDNPQGSTKKLAKPTDRIFQIGNGSDTISLSNALTVLRNGKVGLGNGAINPQYILEIDGRPRIRHTNQTAGLFFSSSVKAEGAFVGMKLDDQVGFYIGDAWRFWVSALGNAELTGSLQQFSDKRLKRDISRLTNSLAKLTLIDGYNYYWKNNKQDQSLQTGVVAQEVEKLFPELISQSESGYKTVNYIGLIPHLIEAIKELREENIALKQQSERIDALEAKLNEIINGTSRKVAAAK